MLGCIGIHACTHAHTCPASPGRVVQLLREHEQAMHENRAREVMRLRYCRDCPSLDHAVERIPNPKKKPAAWLLRTIEFCGEVLILFC